ncbi:hypothetical protein MKW94_005060, partial [Papaver nudicaule]|nr:hypothetical protein [Papaver nudicaule]
MVQVYGDVLGGGVNPKEEVVSPGSRNTRFPSVVSCMNVHSASKGNQKGQKRISTAAVETNQHACTKDHIMAERKRRHKLSQQIIALSAIVPYLKQLQEKVKKLDEKTTKKIIESVIILKKAEICDDDNDSSSSNENFFTRSTYEPLHEIETRVSHKSVLIRIHCEKFKGVSNVVPFDDSSLAITITAQISSLLF